LVRGPAKFYAFLKGLRGFSGKYFFIAPKTTTIKITAAIIMAVKAIPLIANIHIDTSLKI
jgi:hypothetical protein